MNSTNLEKQPSATDALELIDECEAIVKCSDPSMAEVYWTAYMSRECVVNINQLYNPAMFLSFMRNKPHDLHTTLMALLSQTFLVPAGDGFQRDCAAALASIRKALKKYKP